MSSRPSTLEQPEPIDGLFKSLKRATGKVFRGARRIVKKGSSSLGAGIKSANEKRRCNKLQGTERSQCHADRRSNERAAKQVRRYKYQASKRKESLRQLYNKLKDAQSKLDKTEAIVEDFVMKLNQVKQSVDNTADGDDPALVQEHQAHVRKFQRMHAQLSSYEKKWRNARATYAKYLTRAKSVVGSWSATKQPSACSGNAVCEKSRDSESDRAGSLNALVDGARDVPTQRVKFEDGEFSFE